MSKGGRGRGRGNASLNMEALGFGKEDKILPTLQPPPKFPPLRQLPNPLLTGDESRYILALKKEFLQTMRSSPYFIKAEEKKTDVDRYSDKYRASRNLDNTIEWKPDWRRLPKELRIAVRKKRKLNKGMAPNLANAKSKKLNNDVDVKTKLEALEAKEMKGEDGESEKDEEDSENENAEDITFEQEEDDEEANDYITSHFDNGETYVDDEDNLDEEGY